MDSTVLDSELVSEIRGVSRLETSLTTSSFSQGKPTRYPKPFPACLLFCLHAVGSGKWGQAPVFFGSLPALAVAMDREWVPVPIFLRQCVNACAARPACLPL